MLVKITKQLPGCAHPPDWKGELDDDYAKLLIAKQAAESITNTGVEEVIAKSLDAAMSKIATGIDSIVGEQMKALAENAKKFKPVIFKDAVPKDDDTQIYKSLGDFTADVVLSHKQRKQTERLQKWQSAEEEIIKKASPTGMGEAISSDGGYLVPPQFSMKIFERVYGNYMLQMTDMYPIGGNSMTFLANAETSRVAGSRAGGVRGYWVDEAQQLTNSKPTFRKIQLNPHKIAVMVTVTEELLSDAVVALDQYLMKAASDELTFMIGDSLVNGSGVGQPQGILNSNALISVSKETGQAGTTIVSENILKMWKRLWVNSQANAVWFINQDVQDQLQTMSLAVGVGGQLTYMPPGGLASSPYATLMGRPVVPIEFCPTLGTVGDIILADMSQYITCVRGGVKTGISPHLRFDYDETVFKFTWRIDGQTWWNTALTPFKGSNTQSPFIALATRS